VVFAPAIGALRALAGFGGGNAWVKVSTSHRA